MYHLYRFSGCWKLVAFRWQFVALLPVINQCIKTLLLSPSDKAHRKCFTNSQWGLTSNPSEGGFLCSQKHSKVSFELLEINSAAQKYLPLQGAGNPPKSGCLFQPAVAFEWRVFVVILLKSM